MSMNQIWDLEDLLREKEKQVDDQARTIDVMDKFIDDLEADLKEQAKALEDLAEETRSMANDMPDDLESEIRGHAAWAREQLLNIRRLWERK